MANAARTIEAGTVPKAILDELTWRIERGTVDLPRLPAVAMEVTTIAKQEKADARTIAELLRQDPALAGHVLKVVSSPAYGGRMQLFSLPQAVARLGVQKIREISLAIAYRVGVFELEGFEPELTSWFRHSVSAAMFAQEITRATRRDVEDAFMCGLLHDVGRPVILRALVALLNEQSLSVPLAAVMDATGELHANVGTSLAESWHLSEEVEMSIRYHHSPTLPDATANGVLVTALADDLARFALEPQRMTEAQLRKHWTLAPLALYPGMLDKVLGKADLIRQAAGTLS
jgi:putative nucleotidyltransferase with HDIG domain